MDTTWTAEQGALRIAGVPSDRDPSREEIEYSLETVDALHEHLAKGKSIAYYSNEDLGHPMIGHVVAFTYGTPEAQFEPEQFPDGPPLRCPDGLMKHITGGINWRYQLCAVTRALPVIVDTVPAEEG